MIIINPITEIWWKVVEWFLHHTKFYPAFLVLLWLIKTLVWNLWYDPTQYCNLYWLPTFFRSSLGSSKSSFLFDRRPLISCCWNKSIIFQLFFYYKYIFKISTRFLLQVCLIKKKYVPFSLFLHIKRE